MKKNKMQEYKNWLESRKLASETIRIHLWTLKEYGNRDLDTNQIINFLKDNLTKYEASSLRVHRNSLASYAKFQKISIDWELVAKIIPVVQRKFFATIDQTDLEKLKVVSWQVNNSTKESKRVNRRNNLMLEFLFYTGIRVNELLNIKRRDYQSGMLKILGKGNKIRYIFVPEFLVKHFDGSNNYLFTTRKGKKLCHTQARIMIYRKTKKAGINKIISPHTFRRSFATLLNKKSCNLTTIQKLLGHSKIETTASYIHNSYEELYEDYSKLWTSIPPSLTPPPPPVFCQLL